jgi:hypothetical protein
MTQNKIATVAISYSTSLVPYNFLFSWIKWRPKESDLCSGDSEEFAAEETIF